MGVPSAMAVRDRAHGRVSDDLRPPVVGETGQFAFIRPQGAGQAGAAARRAGRVVEASQTPRVRQTPVQPVSHLTRPHGLVSANRGRGPRQGDARVRGEYPPVRPCEGHGQFVHHPMDGAVRTRFEAWTRPAYARVCGGTGFHPIGDVVIAEQEDGVAPFMLHAPPCGKPTERAYGRVVRQVPVVVQVAEQDQPVRMALVRDPADRLQQVGFGVQVADEQGAGHSPTPAIRRRATMARGFASNA